jgi:hypothetical protein
LQVLPGCASIEVAVRTLTQARIIMTSGYSSDDAITPAAIPAAQRVWLDRYRTWKRFHRGVRRPGLPLLKSLSQYPRCVLVAGCQRSGTTMLTRLIAKAPGFARLALTRHDELDAALALAGFIDLPQRRRYCFQTTYLNESFLEYRTLAADQRLIWVVRNPYSVVYSMLYNWRRFALNELYQGCGVQSVGRVQLPWLFGPSRITKACLAYSGKVAQILSIRHLLPPAQLLVVDYDRLVAAPADWLPGIFAFADAPYDARIAREVRHGPLGEADRLSGSARRLIERLTWSTYRECVALAMAPGVP